MSMSNEISYHVPFTSDSSLAEGFHVSAALGGGAPHAFLVDTGSVGILVPRQVLGPDYQDFDASQDITFGYVSSNKTYQGQWVKVPVVLGVPATWSGTGNYPMADIEVFAVDEPADFDGGVFGIGFGIGALADGGPTRNPLLHMHYQGALLRHGYVIGTQGIDVGLAALSMEGFAIIPLDRDATGEDWMQPPGSITLSGDFSPEGFYADLPILMDTGIDSMILWVAAGLAPPELASDSAFPAGITVNVSAPPAALGDEPALQYSFVTGVSSQPMAPSEVEWRVGNGLNTGRNVLAGADYLYDRTQGRIGFRVPPA
jgi:hypothetical protein